MSGERRRARWATIGTLLLLATVARAQEPPPRSALPAVPYWWPVRVDHELELIPLAWYNDVDGVVLGAAARYELRDVRLWWGAGLGLTGEGMQPAGLEAAVEGRHASIGVRHLHGRNAVTLRARPFEVAEGIRARPGVGVLWLDGHEYLERLVFFECPDRSPALPCAEVPTPYGWSPGRDHAIEVEVVRIAGDGSSELRGGLITGLAIAGGDHDYLRATVEGRTHGAADGMTWSARLGGGWVSGDAPLQRRFYLHGGDPVTRWVNPLLEARGAALSDLPYVIDDGPGLRAYSDLRALVKRYVAVGGEVGRTTALGREWWGRFALVANAAWIPGQPDRIGPEQMNAGGAFLFDWRELPDGQDEPLGRFRARVLEPPSVWADAGLALTAGYDRVALRLSLPLWANHAGFADPSPFNGQHRTLQTRWALTFLFQPFPGAPP